MNSRIYPYDPIDMGEFTSFLFKKGFQYIPGGFDNRKDDKGTIQYEYSPDTYIKDKYTIYLSGFMSSITIKENDIIIYNENNSVNCLVFLKSLFRYDSLDNLLNNSDN